MSHDHLVKKAAAFLRSQGSVVTITDLTHSDSETPDAIGWFNNLATLIECKASRSDFLADRKKGFRWRSAQGMGAYRYYLTPQGLLKPDELPPGWGLLELHGTHVAKVSKSDIFHQRKHTAETSLLLSALRRIGAITPKGVKVKHYSYYENGEPRATLGTQNPS